MSLTTILSHSMVKPKNCDSSGHHIQYVALPFACSLVGDSAVAFYCNYSLALPFDIHEAGHTDDDEKNFSAVD